MRALENKSTVTATVINTEAKLSIGLGASLTFPFFACTHLDIVGCVWSCCEQQQQNMLFVSQLLLVGGVWFRFLVSYLLRGAHKKKATQKKQLQQICSIPGRTRSLRAPGIPCNFRRGSRPSSSCSSQAWVIIGGIIGGGVGRLVACDVCVWETFNFVNNPWRSKKQQIKKRASDRSQ